MGTEIERKFLVIDGSWRAGAPGTEIRQGYVHAGADRSVRIRTSGKRAYLTLKQARSGFTRQEYEYDIPLYDAQEMLASMCDGRLIEKTRFSLTVAGRKWVVDEFAGDNQGPDRGRDRARQRGRAVRTAGMGRQRGDGGATLFQCQPDCPPLLPVDAGGRPARMAAGPARAKQAAVHGHDLPPPECYRGGDVDAAGRRCPPAAAMGIPAR
ncbi:MAG: CYTH domain-containing protein [Rhodospirillales bacterium]